MHHPSLSALEMQRGHDGIAETFWGVIWDGPASVVATPCMSASVVADRCRASLLPFNLLCAVYETLFMVSSFLIFLRNILFSFDLRRICIPVSSLKAIFPALVCT
jgi:hypothetical protein